MNNTELNKYMFLYQEVENSKQKLKISSEQEVENSKQKLKISSEQEVENSKQKKGNKYFFF